MVHTSNRKYELFVHTSHGYNLYYEGKELLTKLGQSVRIIMLLKKSTKFDNIKIVNM